MLNNLKVTEGSRKTKVRRCRGLGSGLGKNGGSGSKGQNSRSGGGVRLGFEGGQLPLYRRIKKRGFKSHSHLTMSVINLTDLEKFENGTEVTPELLIENGLVPSTNDGVKVLGSGTLTKKLTVKANSFSYKAKEAIEKNGGQAQNI